MPILKLKSKYVAIIFMGKKVKYIAINGKKCRLLLVRNVSTLLLVLSTDK